MGESWLVKHAPKNSAELVHPAAGKLEAFINGFEKQKRKAILLHGPSGSGKTSAVYALAAEKNLEVVEVNASDVCNEEKILSKMGNALKQHSLFGRGKLVLVDEIDGISGNADRGGVKAITSLMQKSVFPIVLTANNPFEKKFSTLRSKSLLVEFGAPDLDGITKILSRICKKENVSADLAVLKALARRSGGDVRAAINDLQLLAQSKKLSAEEIEGLGERRRAEQLEQALIKIFKSTSPEIAVSAFDSVDTDIDECFLWVDHNLPKEYSKPDDLARAFDSLSKADVFRGRIKRWQYWRFLSYVNVLLTAGVAVGKNKKYAVPPQYSRTTRLLKLWQAKMRYERRLDIARKLAAQTHCSTRKIISHILPSLKFVFQKNPARAKKIIEEFDFDADEIAWLAK